MSDILDRPEFQVLRRLSVEQLRRINPRWARRKAVRTCPLGLALRFDVYDGWDGDVLDALEVTAARPDAADEADAFIDAWDEGGISRADLAAAISAALAEKGGTS